MTDFNSKGLMQADAFAERYFDYQMGASDSAPYELATHMLLVQDAMASDSAMSPAADRIYAKMQPNTRKSVSDFLSKGDYCDKFMNSLIEKHKSVLGDNIDESALRSGLTTDLDQTVTGACSGMRTMTPIQNVREFAKQNGASQDEIKSVVSSALCDLGQYRNACESGLCPSDEASFRCNNAHSGYAVDYNVDVGRDKISMIGVDSVRHDFTGEDASVIMEAAIHKGSLHDTVDQFFNYDAAVRNLKKDADNGITVFGQHTSGLVNDAKSDEPVYPVITKMYFTKNDEPYFTTESKYHIRDINASRDVTSDTLVSKDTVFQSPSGQSLDEDVLDECRRYYRSLGFTENKLMSTSDAALDIKTHSVDQVNSALGGFENGVTVKSNMTLINSKVPKCDVVIGHTHFDMDALSDLLKSHGTELLTSDHDAVFSDDSQSWKLSKAACSDTIQAGIPVGNKSLPVFDFTVSDGDGVNIDQVHIPDITQQEKTEFANLAARYANKGYTDAGFQFDKPSASQSSFSREVPDVSQVYDDLYDIDL